MFSLNTCAINWKPTSLWTLMCQWHSSVSCSNWNW